MLQALLLSLLKSLLLSELLLLFLLLLLLWFFFLLLLLWQDVVMRTGIIQIEWSCKKQVRGCGCSIPTHVLGSRFHLMVTDGEVQDKLTMVLPHLALFRCKILPVLVCPLMIDSFEVPPSHVSWRVWYTLAHSDHNKAVTS